MGLYCLWNRYKTKNDNNNTLRQHQTKCTVVVVLGAYSTHLYNINKILTFLSSLFNFAVCSDAPLNASHFSSVGVSIGSCHRNLILKRCLTEFIWGNIKHTYIFYNFLHWDGTSKSSFAEDNSPFMFLLISLRPSDACTCASKLTIFGSDNGLSPDRH